MFFSLFIISCGQKPLENIDLSEGNYKMYFFYPMQPPNMEEPNEFKAKYKNFYIDDKSALEKIQNQIVQERITEFGASLNIYILRLEKDGEVVDGGILGIEANEFMYYNGRYIFDFSELEELNKYFKKLNSFEVNCITASHTQDFIEYVENSDGFIYGSDNEQTSFKGFKGKIDLVTQVSKLTVEEFKGWKQVEKIIVDDFDKIGETKINYASQVGDSIYLSLLLKDDYTSKIPEKYEIIKPFSDTINVPLQVINIDKDRILNFFGNNDITKYEIKDLN